VHRAEVRVPSPLRTVDDNEQDDDEQDDAMDGELLEDESGVCMSAVLSV
jgi:hypothetical protein